MCILVAWRILTHTLTKATIIRTMTTIMAMVITATDTAITTMRRPRTTGATLSASA